MNTLTRTSILIATAWVLAACAEHGGIAAPAATTDLKGTFTHGEATPAREEYLRIDDQSLTKIVVCRDGGSVARLEVTAPAHVTSSTITILRPALKVERVGEVDCVAKIEVGIAGYAIDPHHRLILHPKHGWRRYFVSVGPAAPGLWRELMDRGAKLKTKLGKAKDTYFAIKREEARTDVEIAEHVYRNLQRLAKRVIPGSKTDDSKSSETKTKD